MTNEQMATAELLATGGAFVTTLDAIKKLISTRDARIAQLEAHIDGFWLDLKNRYDMEGRDYFEQRYPENPLGMASHYVWKRDAKVAQLEAERDALAALLTHAATVEMARDFRRREWVRQSEALEVRR